MKKKILCCALLGAMSMAQSVMAQDYDDRWYLTGSIGHTNTDTLRGVDDPWTWGLGFGKMISPNVSLDVEFDRGIASQGGTLDWDLSSLSLVGRYHWFKEGRNWWPYFAAGIGAAYHNQEFVGQIVSRQGTDVQFQVGTGLQADLGRWDIRTEIGLRFDQDDGYIYGGPPGSPGAVGEDGFMDFYAKVTALVALGPEPVAPVAPAPPAPQPTCADLDDDGDGVNNCDDKCPGSTAGQSIGPDGCPVAAPEPEPVAPQPYRG